jgi:hypothetical protein
MAVFGTDNPAVVAASAAPIGADTGEFLGAYAGQAGHVGSFTARQGPGSNSLDATRVARFVTPVPGP